MKFLWELDFGNHKKDNKIKGLFHLQCPMILDIKVLKGKKIMKLKKKNYLRLKADLFDVFVNEFESNKGHYAEDKKGSIKMNATHRLLQRWLTKNGYREKTNHRTTDETSTRVSEGYPS